MEYRRLGRAGVKVSQLSFGSWVTFSNQMDLKPVIETMAAARDAGVNFFDNAEVYAGGKAEELMGAAFRELRWPRLSYLVSTKFFWGITNDPNGQNTLNRKYLMDAITGSLKRLNTDYVDIAYCHRADPNTPIEETARAMNDMIERGYALYWGTSEWKADEIRAAWEICDKNGWHKPVVEQPQYNLFHRDRVEREYERLYGDIGLGLTIWSPLASGVLTGKYLNGIPAGSRAALGSFAFVAEEAQNERKKAAVREFLPIAKDLGCTPAQLAIAWCSANPNVSTVITGASSVQQVKENMKALEAYERLTPDVLEILNRIFPLGGR